MYRAIILTTICLSGCMANGSLPYSEPPKDVPVVPPPDLAVKPDFTVLPDMTVLPDLVPTCTGHYGICAVPGYTEGKICSTDVGGSDSRAVPEICGNGIDEDCNGLYDNGCDSETPVHLYFGGRKPDPYLYWSTQNMSVLSNGHISCFGSDGVYTISLPDSVNNGQAVINNMPQSSVGNHYDCQVTGTEANTDKFMWSEVVWFIR